MSPRIHIFAVLLMVGLAPCYAGKPSVRDGSTKDKAIPLKERDAVLCPQVVGEKWQTPLVHGLLHLLGYDHGVEMERRESELV